MVSLKLILIHFVESGARSEGPTTKFKCIYPIFLKIAKRQVPLEGFALMT